MESVLTVSHLSSNVRYYQLTAALMPHLICTAGNDRNLRIWDVRHLSKMKPLAAEVLEPPKAEDGAEPRLPTYPTSNVEYERTLSYREGVKGKGLLRASFEHGKSCSAAYWDPWGRRILTTSYDDRLRSRCTEHRIADTSLDTQPPELCARRAPACVALQAEQGASTRLPNRAVAYNPACAVVHKYRLHAALYRRKHEAHTRCCSRQWGAHRQALGRWSYGRALCHR